MLRIAGGENEQKLKNRVAQGEKIHELRAFTHELI